MRLTHVSQTAAIRRAAWLSALVLGAAIGGLARAFAGRGIDAVAAPDRLWSLIILYKSRMPAVSLPR